MMPFYRTQLNAALIWACCQFSPARAEIAGSDFFEKKIRPVLAEQCYECHSQAAGKRRGGLQVDSREALLTGGDTGPAITPGKPEESLLYRALTHREPELAMPSKKPKLPETTLEDFKTWIAGGATWGVDATIGAAQPTKSAFDLEERKRRLPWIWQTPQKQIVPTVQNRRWPSADSDYFILAKLEEKSLSPAPETDPRSWLRRVYFAIVGLPPNPEEVHEFLRDTSNQGRAKVVERLLASPHYGERWARHWMDLMRYAESRGHESDFPIANAYHYRDYLIRALNADVPYNQFVMEHVAGDLLHPPRCEAGTQRNESVLATGWAFLGEEVHSPVDIRQDECERIDNKIDVFSKTFLGLTVSCARCHDHKFDAIQSRDYYALSGFFLSSSYRQVRFESEENNKAIAHDLQEVRRRTEPTLAAVTAAEDRPEVSRVADYLAAAREVFHASASEHTNQAVQAAAKNHALQEKRLRRWLGYLETAAANPQDPLCLAAKILINRDTLSSEKELESLPQPGASSSPGLPSEARVILNYQIPEQPWRVDGPAFGDRPLRLGEICTTDNPTNPVARVMTYGAARRDPFWSGLKLSAGNENDAGPLGATSRAGQMLATPTFTLGTGKLHYLILGKTRVYAAVDSHIMIEGPLHGRLVQVFDSGVNHGPRWVTHDLSAYTGHRVHVEFGPEGNAGLEVLMVVESENAPVWVPELTWRPGGAVHSAQALAEALQGDLDKACERLGKLTIAGSDNAPKLALLADWLVHHPELVAPFRNTRLLQVAEPFCRELKQLGERVQWESQTAVALFDGPGIDENVLVRGKASRVGALALRSIPAAFPGHKTIESKDSSGRYELARELVDPANPLLARVIVNRVWHYLFGRGIVGTVDNFGYLGERPSHPELLDQLAWSFVHEDQWSLKRLIKKLVLSSAFAMSSQSVDGRAEEIDPADILLHRMPVRRLEAEAIRDSLLTISGRLNATVCGPPVPVHLTEFVIGRGRPEKSGPLDGDGRRSIYTAVRRNFLPTMMLAFDMPTPFSTVGRRNVTNVPAQSLALMNDPLFHEQTRIWAERLLRELPAGSPQARMSWLFESAYGRLPEPAETQACLESLCGFAKLLASDTNTVSVWTELCHALVNANDFIYLR